MGLFDFVEDLTSMLVETVVRLPEVPVRVIKGTLDGIEKGIDDIGDSLE